MAISAESLVRKTVTILFCDVVGSTSLGERIDPETTRRVMLRYFDETRTVLERHGATVEKFIGDAVMAVFGVPVLHEDDALRAVRAADELRGTLDRLNEELSERWGVRLEIRVGINTGEVVVGDAGSTQTIASGDPVNIAARLQQAAQAGEVLLGRDTYRLVEDRVTAGPLESFSLKGKTDEVKTWRLEEVQAGAERVFRRLSSPLVDREDERRVLHDVYRRGLEDQTCQVAVVLGPAGIGKSRLAQEFAAELLGPTIATGRCLPYGEGITFWPVVEIVRALAEIGPRESPDAARAQLHALVPDGPDAELIESRVAGLLGVGGRPARSEEAFWALRRLFEGLARARPLVLILEDLHWAEPTLLDLLEYVAGWSIGAPIMLVCLARPELNDIRPAWLNEQANSRVLSLEPLAPTDVDELIASVLGSTGLDASLRRRIVDACGGNPLFVEELVRTLLEDGRLREEDGRWVADDLGELATPSTIGPLIASRLDRLEADERLVLQCGSVVGKEFWWSSVVELAPDELKPRVGPVLQGLVRKRLIEPARLAGFTGDDAFRFGHILVRDAAYASLGKELRAALHERFADWLAERTHERAVEYEEVVGYHLEQASLTLAALAPQDDAARALAARAGSVLASAGVRAFTREDMPAARALLGRAVALLPDGVSRTETRLGYAVALRNTGELSGAADALAEAHTGAVAYRDDALAARIALEQSSLRALTDASVAGADFVDVADRAIVVFEAAGDDVGLAKAWMHLAEMHWLRGNSGEMEHVLERALVHAERVESTRDIRWILRGMMRAALLGPRPVPDAIALCTSLRERARDDSVLSSHADSMLAVLEAMRGNPDDARRLYERSKTTREEMGLKMLLGGMQMYGGMAELVSGDASAAERELRLGYDLLAAMGDQTTLSTTAAYLARSLAEQGRYEEADALTLESEQTASAEDLATQALWRGTRARVLAHRGDAAAAELLAQEAVTVSRETDLLGVQADVLLDLADVLAAAGRSDAEASLNAAAELCDAKGNVVGAANARGRIEELAGARRA
jgi:class 3 adenylate cyclase/tetratricopeptide (TPR) repeat protein